MDDEWDDYYQRVVEHAGRMVDEQLDRFGESLGDWLHGQLNWPSETWQRELDLLVEHTRYYGLEIAPHSIEQIRDLVAARIDGSRPFAALGPYRFNQTVSPEAAATIQLAMGVSVDDAEATDATLPLDAESESTMRDGVEVAGPGPETTRSFQEKVRFTLALIDLEIAAWWRSEGGQVRSRAAAGWKTFWRHNEWTLVEDETPVVLVDAGYSAAQTAAAIVRGTHAIGPFRDRFDQFRIARGDAAEGYTAIQHERLREAAAIAGSLAEAFYASLATLNTAGDLVVTVSEIADEGFHWQLVLVALPLIPHLPGTIRSLTLKFSGGKTVKIDGKLLKELKRLDKAEYERVTAPVTTANSPEEALERLKYALADSKNSPYQVHVDPQTSKGPMAIDTSRFSSGTPTRAGGIRNSRAFWQNWLIKYGDTISNANRARIKKGLAPVVAQHWLRSFPEHSPYLGDVLVHNHLDNGPQAIPVPDTAHRRQPGWRHWHTPPSDDQ